MTYRKFMLLTAYSVIIESKLDLWRKTLNRFYQLFRLRRTMLACVLIDVTTHEFVNHKSLYSCTRRLCIA